MRDVVFTLLWRVLIALFVVTLLNLVVRCAPPVQAAIVDYTVLRVQPIPQDGLVQVTVLFVGDHMPNVSTEAALGVRIFPTHTGDGRIRATITATLDQCAGRLTITDGADTRSWRPYCQLLPLVSQ